MSLINSAVSGIKWVSLSRFFKQGVQVVTLIILAKLLDVSDFGLMSTAMIYIGFLQVVYDLGLSAALIQKDEVSDKLFSSVFWLNVVVGLIITLLVILMSQPLANFHAESQLGNILKILSVVFVISSITTAQKAMIEKKLDFNVISRIEIYASLSGAIVGIILAVTNFGVWSLVFQSITIAFVTSVLIWYKYPQKPNIFFSAYEIKSIFKFSVNLSGFNLINYFVRNADYFLISKFLGVEALGLYSLAYRLMLYPLQNISYVLSRVMYPVYSILKENNTEFRRMFVLVTKGISLITFPMMLGLMAVSDLFVIAVLGEKWIKIIPLILVLSPLGLIQSVYSPAGAIYQAKNKTDVWLKWGIVSGILTVISFIIGLKWGVLGVAISYLVVNVLLIIPGMKIPFNFIDLKITSFINAIIKTLFCGLIMFAIILLVKKSTMGMLGSIYELLLLIIIGIIAYIGLSILLNKDNLKEIISLVREKTY